VDAESTTRFLRVEEWSMLARQIVVGFGLAAIFPWLIYFGLSTFYPAPKTQDYYGSVSAQPPPPTATAEERRAYADEQQKKRDAFNVAARDFARVLFTVSTVLGVAAILIGAYLPSHVIGAGLIIGGILSLGLVGHLGYQQHLDDWIRFTSLLAGFGALLFVGYRKLAGP
jgi:hypothetical protein